MCAHELDIRNGKAAMCYVGNEKPWHGLGQSLDPNMPVEEWEIAAGMDWDIKPTPVKYDFNGEEKEFEGKVVLSRSDSGEALSIVSDSYKIVQPKDVLHFFSDIVSEAGLRLDTAGVLFGGRRFWAMAKANDLILPNGDKFNGNILLSTSCDGSIATQASFVATRVVCNNTLTLALNKEATNKVKVSHRMHFNPTAIKQQMGLIDEAWETFKDNVFTLQSIKLTDNDALKFVQKVIASDVADIKDPELRQIGKVMGLYTGKGMGSMSCYGNAYGLMNAFTEHVDHHGSQHNDSSRLWNTFHGKGSDLKVEVYNELLNIAA
jgi:phage/plasmid-like protein (TIGR03299 family)